MKRPPQPCGGLLVSGVEEISDLLHNEILKREVIEGDKVTDAASRMKKAMQKIARAQAKAAASSAQGSDSTSTVHSATEEDLDSADLAIQSSIIAEED